MGVHSMRGAIITILGVAVFTAPAGLAQQPAAPSQPAGNKVVQITGLVGVEARTKGTLTIESGNLQFANSKTKVSLPIPSLEDVVTDNDSQRVLRGTFGTMTLLFPYGAGRFLSLFRSKIDTLTIQYRDADGALHGAIFTMAVGKADPFKKDLVAQGARTTIPIPQDSGTPDAKPGAAQEKKP